MCLGCSKEGTYGMQTPPGREPLSLRDVAVMFASLPLNPENLDEVYDAVSSSSKNGYDEEYLMKDILDAPGCGVGASTKARAASATAYSRPLRSLISDYLLSTRAGNGRASAEDYLERLRESGMQIYFPYSEKWEGSGRLPVITYNPGYGAESNWGYELGDDGSGVHIVDSLVVTEETAMQRPVWVINDNDDSAYTPLELICRDPVKGASGTKGRPRMLTLKSFKMLRNYDSWFGGASEFFIKCGSLNGFTARTEAELKLYSPSVTDMMIVVKRSEKDIEKPLGTILMTDFTNQLDQIAFLITEDDGGTTTSWKCSAVVKVNSKSYGFDVDIPYKDKDDIVWRGQLSANFFQSADEVTGRFGDVEVTFVLD